MSSFKILIMYLCGEIFYPTYLEKKNSKEKLWLDERRTNERSRELKMIFFL